MSENRYKVSELIVLLDLETGGLDPSIHPILEIGAKAVWAKDLSFAGCFHRIVRYDPDADDIESDCVAMHTTNGLLAESVAAPTKPWEALEDLDVWLLSLQRMLARTKDDSNEVQALPLLTLGGSSVHFDRSFLQLRRPQLVRDRFSHRVLDLTSARLACDLLHIPLTPTVKSDAHRALDDVDNDLQWLMQNRRFSGIDTPGPAVDTAAVVNETADFIDMARDL